MNQKQINLQFETCVVYHGINKEKNPTFCGVVGFHLNVTPLANQRTAFSGRFTIRQAEYNVIIDNWFMQYMVKFHI